jgi:hypothetical protein
VGYISGITSFAGNPRGYWGLKGFWLAPIDRYEPPETARGPTQQSKAKKAQLKLAVVEIHQVGSVGQ